MIYVRDEVGIASGVRYQSSYCLLIMEMLQDEQSEKCVSNMSIWHFTDDITILSQSKEATNEVLELLNRPVRRLRRKIVGVTPSYTNDERTISKLPRLVRILLNDKEKQGKETYELLEMQFEVQHDPVY